MTRHTLLLIVTAFLTLGWVGELFAQVPSAMSSSSRRSSLLGASRIGMFQSGGGLNVDRNDLKSESLADSGNSDRMMSMLQRNDLATMLGNSTVNNMNVFLTYSGALQTALGLDDTTAPVGTTGEIIMSQNVTSGDDLTQAIATIGRSGMYPPRLRFWFSPEELEAMQTPEAVAQMGEADRIRAAELVTDINDTFDLPKAANISLQFDGLTAVIQGRVPNPTVRKQVEMYLGFEPGIYSVQNHLVVDPSVLAATDSVTEAP